jgi:hypothetical protein
MREQLHNGLREQVMAEHIGAKYLSQRRFVGQRCLPPRHCTNGGELERRPSHLVQKIRKDPVDSRKPIQPCESTKPSIEHYRVKFRYRRKEFSRQGPYGEQSGEVDILWLEGNSG